MNVAVGGTNSYFPDNMCGKTWSNTSSVAAGDFWYSRDKWYPSWKSETDQSALQVDDIKVWSFVDSEEQIDE